jgi:hypothetical protein
LIGKTIDIVVTSVLQTTAGKMIFGRFVDQTAGASPGNGPSEREEGPRRPRVAPAPQAQAPVSSSSPSGIVQAAVPQAAPSPASAPIKPAAASGSTS